MDTATRKKIFKSKDKCSYSHSESETKSHDHAKKKKKKKSKSKSSEVSSMMLLSQDLMIDILSRLSLKCLLSSARYVCKPWATIIGSSDFAKMHQHRSLSKPGLFVENLNSNTSSYFLDIKDDFNDHFEIIKLGTPLGMRRLESTCDGVWLFWDHQKQIFVLNPILKCCLRLPPLPTTKRVCRSNFVLARVPHTVIFKVFFVDLIEVSDIRGYVFYVLEIGVDNSWKEIARKKVIHEPNNFRLSFLPELLYSGGNYLYKITCRGVVVIDVDKEIAVGEYPPPIPLLEDLRLVGNYLWMENHLSCIVKNYATKTYQIYFFNIDSRKWTFYHEMGPFDYVAACGHELDRLWMYFRFWMKGQFIIELRYRQSEERITIHFVYNVNTRQLTKMEGVPEGNFKVWLHTNSLASLPSAPS